ncbi:hypothetical protein RclHR1_09380002 [Rhizophagus clarus]|uniref:Attractin/MKLN-like beta-propeller domain-containing protein n=1 Tax=Rhizophagus clarus TaxID=94130 RepID=A0A2Z6SIE2_9GLOM|nr:hypothetical protein RclHR1_09380002 [Rhizophagus clarus]GES94807.1 hypothetical protein GLOIN_2v1761507 [Rhizophagus clarus]
MAPYKPEQRDGHTATLIDNKLYILGGEYIDGSGFPDVGKDFFYLDVSVSLNTQNLLWNDLSNINTVPTHYDAASVGGGANDSTLFLYGGNSSVTTMELVYAFDPQSNSWSIPKITGGIPARKHDLTGIIDHKGLMYLWGGSTDTTLNDMLILDTINFVWEKGGVLGVPTAREYYGATLLADNNIIYMGGYSSNELALNEVYLYDTINNNWSTKTTSGIVPSGRDGFSAILGLDGQRVIIFGGSTTLDNKNLNPQDSLYELNLVNFEWSIPKISGQIPISRMYHKANVIGNYMVISFGDGYDRSTGESDILLLDISKVDDYVWTNEFYPPPSSPQPPPPPPPPSSPSSSSSPSPTSSSSMSSLSSTLSSNMSTSGIPSSATSPTTVIGAVIGSFFGGALLSFGGFYLYKNRRRNDNNQVEREIYNYGQEIVQPSRNEHIVINEPPVSVVNKSYNHAQELIPIANNVHELQQEIQDLRQIILQNNRQSTNTMENNN